MKTDNDNSNIQACPDSLFSSNLGGDYRKDRNIFF